MIAVRKSLCPPLQAMRLSSTQLATWDASKQRSYNFESRRVWVPCRSCRRNVTQARHQRSQKCRKKAGALDDRDTRLRNVAHPCAPARRPEVAGNRIDDASGRAPVEAPTGKVVGQPHHRGASDGTAPRRAARPPPPRGGSRGEGGAAEGQLLLLQRRSTTPTARLTSTRSSAR